MGNRIYGKGYDEESRHALERDNCHVTKNRNGEKSQDSSVVKAI
jgi:hypothetical protein